MIALSKDGTIESRCHGTSEGHVYFEVDGPVGYIIIDGPTDLNPMTPDMYQELYDVMVQFRDHPEVKVGVLAGAGPRAFSAGGDLKAGSSRIQRLTREDRFRHFWNPRSTQPTLTSDVFGEILDLEIYRPIVGVVNGPCVGGAFCLLLTLTDIRIVTATSVFGLPEVKIGMSGAGGHSLIARHVPLTTAMWMVLTGEKIDAAEAYRIGMVNEVVPLAGLMSRAQEVAEKVSRISPVVARVEKELVLRSLDLPRKETMRLSWVLSTVQKVGHDFEEGYRALADRRDPDFQGW
jgi:enoyl-CoA hydratase/carnithine racemase